jgi:glyoxylase-like metal-dependent hydrolase (beta-lactamase superfamily II)
VVGADDKPLFPNAQYYIAQSDFDFWTDEGKMGSPVKDFIVHARKNLLPVRDRLVFYKDGQEFLPGVQAIAAPGHTVGHTMVRVSSDGSDLLIWGDIMHCPMLQFAEPERGIAFDTDQAMAIASRRRVLDMVTTDRTLFAGAHLPFPGVGYSAKSGSGYAYVPLNHADHY